ncbi:MAG: outer membrane lipoprotein chaperone LolA [Betaproteobacteria bacterium]|nr:outer membrane lipoprotein chaperone LolA [Betaproteobacteria bacterium]
MRIFALIVAAAPLAIALSAAAPAHAQAIPKFQQFLTGTPAGSATFEQRVFERGDKLIQQSKGQFAFSRPGKFRWTYDKPKQVIVGDGDKVWIYDEDLQQVTARKLGNALSSTPAALLTGGAEVAKLFTLKEEGVKDGIDWLEAKPRQGDTGFERIRIGFRGDALAEMELFDQFGNRTALRFSALKRGPQDAAQFRFVAPKGADVIAD